MSILIDGTAGITYPTTQLYVGNIASGTTIPYTSATNSSTTIDFTSIPSWVKRITVMYNGLSAGTSNYLIQLITGTSTVVNSGYVSSCRSATSTAGFLTIDGPTGASLISGAITISTMTGNVWVSSGVLQIASGSTYQSAGVISLAAALTGIRITTVTPDAFDAGSVNILYE